VVKTLMLKAIKKEKNRDIYRNRLRIETQPVFDILRSIGLSHMRYHMPDSTSLLRMHRPFYYGDTLAPFRQTVITANKTDKMVKGFENGMICAMNGRISAANIIGGAKFTLTFLKAVNTWG